MNSIARRNFSNRTFYTGDNLGFLQGMDSKSVDLIVIDPPFKKDKKFQGIGTAEGAEFKDYWSWEDDVQLEWLEEIRNSNRALSEVVESAYHASSPSMAAFIAWMSVRVMEMHRILKNTGSMYLHCDYTANSYLRAMMDAVFGHENMRNEIIWCYTGPSNVKRWFPRKHDTLLFYAASKDAVFNKDNIRIPYSESSVKRSNYKGSPTIGMNFSTIKIHADGKIPEDYWTDIPAMKHLRNENTGWPTQKPLALYRRIIEASSNPGDMVMDAFAGCATTCVAAEQLNRQWVAMDISPKALKLVYERLQKEIPDWLDRPVVTPKDPPTRVPDLPITFSFDAPERKNKRQVPLRIPDARKALMQRDGMFCQGCGYEPPFEDYLEIDHKLPKADGGGNNIENICLLCPPCNKAKAHRLTLSGLKEDRKKANRIVNPENLIAVQKGRGKR